MKLERGKMPQILSLIKIKVKIDNLLKKILETIKHLRLAPLDLCCQANESLFNILFSTCLVQIYLWHYFRAICLSKYFHSFKFVAVRHNEPELLS